MQQIVEILYAYMQNEPFKGVFEKAKIGLIAKKTIKEGTLHI